MLLLNRLMWETSFVFQHYKRCFTDPLLLLGILSVKELLFPGAGRGRRGRWLQLLSLSTQSPERDGPS